MRNIIVFLICFNFIGLALYAGPKYGPAGVPKATPIVLENSYFRSNKAPDFWALTGFYVAQFSPSACSVASVATILNAAIAERSREGHPRNAELKVITQEQLVDTVKVEGWKERVNGKGHQGEHGTGLDTLSTLVVASFKEFGFPKAKATVFVAEDSSTKTIAAVEKILLENEKSARDFILANFDQKVFTDDTSVGHVAPVGAYDHAKKRVLILDPDREYYEPYWVSLETFVRGMATKDSSAKKNRGLVRITL